MPISDDGPALRKARIVPRTLPHHETGAFTLYELAIETRPGSGVFKIDDDNGFKTEGAARDYAATEGLALED